MITERKLTPDELAKREDIINTMIKNKRSLVSRYGKDAEKVMYGRATNSVKKQTEKMETEKLREMVKTALMTPIESSKPEQKKGQTQEESGAQSFYEKQKLSMQSDWDDMAEFQQKKWIEKYKKEAGPHRDDKTIENINEDWGSSDQSIMNREMHKDLGEPTQFPRLEDVLNVAKTSVDYYWSDWNEYNTDRKDLINKAATKYYKAYFPEMFAKMQQIFSSRIDEKHLTTAEKNKKEDIVKGMKKSFKGDKSSMYAIATSKAKKLAENDILVRKVIAKLKK